MKSNQMNMYIISTCTESRNIFYMMIDIGRQLAQQQKRQQNHSIKSITFYIVNRSINWYEYATTQKFRWRFGVEDHKIPFNYAWAAGECVTHTHYIHTETRETPHDAHILNTNNMIHCGTYWRLFCFFCFLFIFLSSFLSVQIHIISIQREASRAYDWNPNLRTLRIEILFTYATSYKAHQQPLDAYLYCVCNV